METFGAYKLAEVGAQRHGILPCLVLRPAVKFAAAKSLGLALIAIRARGCAPLVVSFHLGKIFSKAFFVHCRIERQSRRDPAFLRRPSNTHTCNGNNFLG